MTLNLPNFLTILRVVSVPFFIYFLLEGSQLFRFLAFVLFGLASITDLIDGYLARKWKQETELGKFLDPLADKMLVLGAFITFLFVTHQVRVWMVLCIIGRDMLITVLRYLAIQKGMSMRTSRFAKIKTSFQMFAIISILLSLFFVSYRDMRRINEEYRVASLEEGIGPNVLASRNLQKFVRGEYRTVASGLASFVPYFLMLLTTIVTVISGLRYLFTNISLLWPPVLPLGRAGPTRSLRVKND